MSSALQELLRPTRLCRKCVTYKPTDGFVGARCKGCVNAAALVSYHRRPENRPYQAALVAIRRSRARAPLAKRHVIAMAAKLLSLPVVDRDAILQLVREGCQ